MEDINTAKIYHFTEWARKYIAKKKIKWMNISKYVNVQEIKNKEFYTFLAMCVLFAVNGSDHFTEWRRN